MDRGVKTGPRRPNILKGSFLWPLWMRLCKSFPCQSCCSGITWMVWDAVQHAIDQLKHWFGAKVGRAWGCAPDCAGLVSMLMELGELRPPRGSQGLSRETTVSPSCGTLLYISYSFSRSSILSFSSWLLQWYLRDGRGSTDMNQVFSKLISFPRLSLIKYGMV